MTDITTDSERQLSRITALFTQAEDPSATPEEAKAFMEKAQELLTKYSLSEYDVTEFKGQTTDTVTTVAIRINDAYCAQKSVLLAIVARANNLQIVYGNMSREYGPKESYGTNVDFRTGVLPRKISVETLSKNYRHMYVSGFTKDIEATTLLYTSFLIQINKLTKSPDIPEYISRGTWTRHFILGFASEVGARLMLAKAKAEQEVVNEHKATGGGMDLVLVSRKEQVKAEHDRVWKGQLKSVSTGMTKTSTSGLSAGRSAGRTADIGNKRNGGVASIGRGN